MLLSSAVHDEQPPQPSAAQALPTSEDHTRATVDTSEDHTRPTVDTSEDHTRATVDTSEDHTRATVDTSEDHARPTVDPLPPAEPVRLRIASIGVDAPMTRVGLNPAGALRAPPRDKADLAGWYGDGTAPGSPGTAIATGHLDTPTGDPGVFYNLGALTEGATIEIRRADRRTAVFAVRGVELYDRKRFPSKKVYGSSGRPELRLITCGGGYTKRTGYLSNVVVYATLTTVK
ncbi:class F sortase [Streptomyces viridiviolaceus]|uniref:Class F sortase n=1 Tax=Streptomyces viridiviolaceus TaxID=68282 RepID=A0ABW2E6K8_9ACTN|nr:class F sortase [Streptomyces viridiviolaceus]